MGAYFLHNALCILWTQRPFIHAFMDAWLGPDAFTKIGCSFIDVYLTATVISNSKS